MTVRALILLPILVPVISAQSTPITVVSAASYRSTIAADSLATIFGANLARATASATLDSSGQLPTELAATRVEVNGQEARLIYVSPGQINFVVPAGIAAGTTTVLVRSTDTGASRSAAVQIAASAPAIFSSDASGRGPGAILNAVTFSPAPFVVATAENGADTRTRLAVYGTGFRHARTVTATATDSKSNRIDLTVEFAGAAPGFFGLDQLNAIVPAQLDGAGAVSLSIDTEDASSNTVTFQMNLLAASSLQLAGIALSPPFVNAGDSMTATVSLNGVARAGGFGVALRSSNLVVQVAASVTIPQGKVSVDTVAITAAAVATVQTGSITAQAGDVTLSADFEVDTGNQAQLSAITVTPASTLGGRNLQGTVSLSGAAPAGGVNVQVASDSASVRPPAAVTVPFHESSVSFPIASAAVSAQQDATLAATLGRTTVSTKVRLLPLLSLSLDSAAVIGGAAAKGTITLADPAAAGGATISLSSSDPGAARVPIFITIPAGEAAGTFSITTSTVGSPRTVTIAASYSGVTQSVPLTVNPQPTAALAGISISADHVNGGTSTQGTVALTAPAGAGGMLVTLQSSSLSAAQVPGFVIVPQGLTSAIFTIFTMRVPAAQTVTITASAAGVSKTATLTVQ